MEKKSTTERHPQSLKTWVDVTFGQLMQAFGNLRGAEISALEFDKEILRPIRNQQFSPNTEPIDILVRLLPHIANEKGVAYLASSSIGPILLSATYAVSAYRESLEGNADLAWSCLADARYWCGVQFAKDGMSALFKPAVEEAKRKQAMSGGKARASRYDPIKQFAYDQVRSRSLHNGGWKSRNEAVQKIKDAVLKRSVEEKINLVPTQATKTIDKWLKEMPDADTLFPKRVNSVSR
ncbi:hypothetical protein [Castellaniella sp.]|uniref:hypothetical protein n=1 Tax=Castellaniella sp. TaxID=1955812 RepID=UPI003A9576B4